MQGAQLCVASLQAWEFAGIAPLPAAQMTVSHSMPKSFGPAWIGLLIANVGSLVAMHDVIQDLSYLQ